MVRALASHQCGPGSNPGVDAMCGLSLLLVLSLATMFFLRVLRFSPLLKTNSLFVIGSLLCFERFFSGCSGFPFSSKPILCLLLVLSFAPRGFSPGTPVFPSHQKPTFPNSNSTRNQVDEEPLCGCATCKLLFIYRYLFIHLLSFERVRVIVSCFN